MRFIDLPEVILEYIHSYLSRRSTLNSFNHSDQVAFYQLRKEESQWRRFLNTNKKFLPLKGKSVLLLLKNGNAERYLKDELFRHRINSLIINKHEQLGFQISSRSHYIISRPYWDYCNIFSFANITGSMDLINLQNVKRLEISWCAVPLLYQLQNVESLIISNSSVEMINNCPKIKKLIIFHCSKIQNISNLPDLRCLSISGAANPSIEISSEILENLHYLTITETSLLQNISFSQTTSLKSLTTPLISPLTSTTLLSLNVLQILSWTNVSLETLKLLSHLTKLDLMHCSIQERVFPAMNHLQYLQFSSCIINHSLQYNSSCPLKCLTIKNCSSIFDIQIDSLIHRIIFEGNGCINLPSRLVVRVKCGITLPHLTFRGLSKDLIISPY